MWHMADAYNKGDQCGYGDGPTYLDHHNGSSYEYQYPIGFYTSGYHHLWGLTDAYNGCGFGDDSYEY